MNRLKTVWKDDPSAQQSVVTLAMNYDPLGNMTAKSDIGTMSYDPTGRPHALQQIVPTGTYLPCEHHIDYFSSGRTKKISDEINDIEIRKIEFTYGPDDQRRKTVYSENSNIVSKYFAFGNFEETVDETTGDVTKILYISSPDGLVAMRKTVNGTTNMYYVLTDHLGSSSFITNATGYATEHLQYLPYGELFVDQTPPHNDFETRYKFSGKELDPESNYSYFGARYYDSDLSVWLSVDPLSDKYPSTSPYMYVMGNPLILIDPNGMSTVGPDNYTIYEDSKTVTKQTTTDNTNTYTYVRSDGTKVDLGTYDKVTNANGEDMVQAANSSDGSNSMYKWVDIKSKNWYFPEDGFALLLGGLQNFYEKNEDGVSIVQFNQFMSLNGSIHTNTYNWPPSIDIAFYFNDGTTGARTSYSNISLDLNVRLLKSLKGFGVGVNAKGEFEGEIGKPGYHIYSWSNETRSAFFEGTQGCPNHHHHFHFENYDHSRIRLLYPFPIPR